MKNNMKLIKGIGKIPGILMLGPLVLGLLINSVFPAALSIGGFTSELFKNGGATLMALFLFCSGTTIRFSAAGRPLVKGAVFIVSKFIFAALITLLVYRFFGFDGILGLTPLALIPAITNTNGALYIILVENYGEESDPLSFLPLLISEGPFLTLIVLNLIMPSAISSVAIFSMVVPLLTGMILGNFNIRISEFFSGGMKILIPFLGFNVGASLNFNSVIEAGLPGFFLGLFVLIVFSAGGYFLNNLFSGKRTVAGAALGTTAANSVMTPPAVALVLPGIVPYVSAASTQLAAATLISSLLCPVVMLLLDKRLINKNAA